MLKIDGVDTAIGLDMMGGSMDAYIDVLDTYRQDAEERLPIFTKAPENEDALKTLASHAHAIKSASASIGAAEVSKMAALLERAGKDGDEAYVKENIGHFHDELASLANRILRALENIHETLTIAHDKEASSMTSDMTRKTVMMIDDSLANLKIGKSALGEIYTVLTAVSAEKMFDLLERHCPELILLDIDMPGMDGYDAIQKLKENPKTRDIPVIFLTGVTDSENEKKGLDLGAVDYIQKPFSPDNLRSRVAARIQ
ncbi:hypothetical protein AGMMS50276_11440 [Synergistales bacterium]|nr:hypothetical protein AGMMS50276_11440 [Synergistales bacterium]